MKRINLLIYIGVIVLLFACQKNDDLTVTLKTSGSLKVQLTDSVGNKLPQIKVRLFTYYSIGLSTSYGGEVDTKRSDENGNINFGILNAGTYYVVTDTITIGSKKYIAVKPVQIISGEDKTIVVNPTEYVGNIKLHVNLFTSGMIDTFDRKTLNVALVPSIEYVYKTNRQSVINKATSVKTCDTNGNIVFDKVPSGISYYAYVYFNNNNDTIGAWYDYAFSVNKDESTSKTVSANLTDLYTVKADLSLTLRYYSSPSYKPVAGVNVILVYSNDFNNYNLYYAGHNTILSYKVVSGITDNSGLLNIKGLPANKSYYAYIYYSNTKYVWSSSSIYVYSTQENQSTITVSGSDLGL